MADPIVKRIVCLANSRKLSGRCIAGKEPKTGRWVRPVSDREHEEVSERERQYENGRDPRLLDIIDVPLLRAKPNRHQPENWLLHPDYYWVHMRRAEVSDLDQLTDRPSVLWVNGSSTVDGQNDRVAVDHSGLGTESLYLIGLDSLLVHVLAPGAAFGSRRRKVKGELQYRGVNYRLTVTDPEVERTYLAKPDGRYVIGPCFVTVSLGEPHEGYCYKLIAAVIPRRDQ